MEYKCKDGMIDNRKVKDSHQEGISRVIQRKSDKMAEKRVSEKGSMAGGWKHDGGKKSDHFKRSGDSLTPRKA